MRNAMLLLVFVLAASSSVTAQEYKVVTVVESIVPMGVGRSRIIQENDPSDYKKFTTDRTDGKQSGQSDIARQDLKINAFSETKLLNFYSGFGINFQNIASNDAIISSKINAMVKEGWSLFTVVSGVESDSGKKDRVGIYITRLIFKK